MQTRSANLPRITAFDRTASPLALQPGQQLAVEPVQVRLGFVAAPEISRNISESRDAQAPAQRFQLDICGYQL
jgi:hypothetical protein